MFEQKVNEALNLTKQTLDRLDPNRSYKSVRIKKQVKGINDGSRNFPISKNLPLIVTDTKSLDLFQKILVTLWVLWIIPNPYFAEFLNKTKLSKSGSIRLSSTILKTHANLGLIFLNRRSLLTTIITISKELIQLQSTLY